MRSRMLVDAIAIGLMTMAFHAMALTGEVDGATADDQTQASTVVTPKQVDTVTVSARKRSENVQDTPISISTFSGYGLEERGITNISQVGPMTPNVSFDAGSAISGSSNSSAIFIRGVGQADFNVTMDPRALRLHLAAIALRVAENGGIDLLTSFSLVYAQIRDLPQSAINALLSGITMWVLIECARMQVFVGALSDRIGRLTPMAWEPA